MKKRTWWTDERGGRKMAETQVCFSPVTGEGTVMHDLR